MNPDRYVNKAVRTESCDFDAISKRLQDPKLIRLLHVGMGLATEAGEFVDQLKKHIFYGKELDLVNLGEEIGDTEWYCAVGADALNQRLSHILFQNIAKLEARFPEKFTEEEANSRDLDRERKVLESTIKCPNCECPVAAGTHCGCGYLDRTEVDE